VGHTAAIVKRPRIVLVEDEEQTRTHLARVLDGDPRLELAASVGTFADGLHELGTQAPDVLVTDIELPDGNGLDLIRFISDKNLDTLPMVITVFGDQATVTKALEAGALGYLLKDGTADYLVRSTLELLEGGSPISPPIARYLLGRFREERQHPAAISPVSSKAKEDVPRLSDRESEVLEFLVKGFTYAETAEHLGVTPHTIATHVRRIYRKLAVRSRAEAVYEALQLGLIRDH
jgi:DNA-binding NarL/FixJ family response regulator